MIDLMVIIVKHFNDILLETNLLQRELMSQLNILFRDVDVASLVIMEVANNDLVIFHCPNMIRTLGLKVNRKILFLHFLSESEAF